MKTSELTGAALDWAVAKCEGYDCQFDDSVLGAWLIPQEGYLHDEKPLSSMRYSTNWAQSGSIIEREGMHVDCLRQGASPVWEAWPYVGGTKFIQQGTTPLIAAMRCYVASKLGDEIEIPKELL